MLSWRPFLGQVGHRQWFERLGRLPFRRLRRRWRNSGHLRIRHTPDTPLSGPRQSSRPGTPQRPVLPGPRGFSCLVLTRILSLGVPETTSAAMVRTMRATHRIHTLVSGILSVALLLAGTVPDRGSEPCLRLVVQEDHHHTIHHGAVPNNTPDHRSDSCHHCPPTSLLLAPPVRLSPQPPMVPPPLPEQVATRIVRRSSEPPTPPPQSLFRLA